MRKKAINFHGVRQQQQYVTKVVVMPMCFTAALQRIYFDASRKIAKEKDIVCLDAAGKCT